MLMNWSPELVTEILSTVDPQHRAIFDVTRQYKLGETPSVYFFRKHGHRFSDHQECQQARNAAFTAVRAAFKSRGIRCFADLDFPSQEKTLEGRLQQGRRIRGSFLADP